MARSKGKKQDKVFLVIGLGTFGRRVCEVLAQKGGKVIALDNREDKINRVKDKVTQAVIMDTTDEQSYTQVPLEDVDIAVVAIGENLEGSILTTAILKQRGISRIIARAITPIHRQVLNRIGADDVINIEENEGEELASRLIAPQILDSTALSNDISISEVYCPGDFAGKALRELDLRKRLNINVVAIKRSRAAVDEEGNSLQEDHLIFPEAGLPLEESDTLVVVGYNNDINRLHQL